MPMTIDIAKEIIAKQLPLDDGFSIWLDVWEYRFKRFICRIRGHVPHSYGDNIITPYEKWCDRCQANLLAD